MQQKQVNSTTLNDDSDDELKCDICSQVFDGLTNALQVYYTFESQKRYNKHKLKHTASAYSQYFCYLCSNVRYDDPKELIRHFEQTHGIPMNVNVNIHPPTKPRMQQRQPQIQPQQPRQPAQQTGNNMNKNKNPTPTKWKKPISYRQKVSVIHFCKHLFREIVMIYILNLYIYRDSVNQNRME